MHRLGLFILFVVLLAPPARAQNLIAEYQALLGPADHYNSAGLRLEDFGAILQQDRANYHRFGRRDDLDGWDPVFGDPRQRALIPQIWRIAPGSEYIPGSVVAGGTSYVSVRVFGYGTVAEFIIVQEGAG